MFGDLAHLMYRRRRRVIGIWLVVLIIAGGLAGRVGSVLGPGDYVTKGSDSAKAAALLDTKFQQNDQKVTLVVVHDPRTTVDDRSFRHAANGIVRRIRGDAGLHLAYLDNPIVSGNRQLISTDHHSIAIMLSSALAEPQIEAQIDHLRQVVRTPGVTTYVTGTPAANLDSQKLSKDDLAKGDAITVPILIVILLLVFGTLVGAALPIVLAASSIVLSLALVFILGHFVNTVVFVTNMVTVLGLGIGIDYSLFILYRFREELQASRDDIETAVVRTMETTGRSVFFSGLTVAIAISSLLLTGVPFMTSMGLGGLLVPLTALLVAMTLLPALLSVLGSRVNRLRVIPRRFLQAGGGGTWRRLATAIMRRPLVYGGVALALLLALSYPATKLNFAFGSLKNAPTSQEAVAGALFMEARFPSAPNPTQIVIQHTGANNLFGPAEIAGLRTFEQAIRQDPEAARVVGPADFLPSSGEPSNAQKRAVTGTYVSVDGETAIISVVARHDIGTTAAEQLVRRLRHAANSATAGVLSGNEIYVGGAQATSTDFNDSLYAKAPLIVAVVLLLTYGFLFFAFRSIFLPFKAVALNLLSVGAAYGLLQLVFQRGVGAHQLGFVPESGVAGWVPIFLFAMLFGLSMDYEVFLLSRVRERWLSTGDNQESVINGLQRTGRLISSAAAIMVVAFSGFVLGSQVQIKELGFGMLASVAIDATLIRIVLVPAIMQIVGAGNWWVPARLRGFAQQASAFAEGDISELETDMTMELEAGAA